MFKILKKTLASVSVLSVSSFVTLSAWADGAATTAAPVIPAPATGVAPVAAAGAAGQPGMGSMMMPMIAMFAVVYFMMIRPQQKKVKEQTAMLGGIKDGDEVVTSSGILGKVTGVAEKVVTLEIATNVKIKLLKSQVAQVVKGQIKDLA